MAAGTDGMPALPTTMGAPPEASSLDLKIAAPGATPEQVSYSSPSPVILSFTVAPLPHPSSSPVPLLLSLILAHPSLLPHSPSLLPHGLLTRNSKP